MGISFVGANTAEGDNHVDMEIILNKKQIQIGEPLVIDFLLDPYVPNTPFRYVIYPDGKCDTFTISECWDNVYPDYFTTGPVREEYIQLGNLHYDFRALDVSKFVHWFSDNTPSGSYTLQAEFGPSDMLLAKAEMDFTIQNDENNINDILRDKYLPGILDIGTNWKASDKLKSTSTPPYDPCIYFTCEGGLIVAFHGPVRDVKYFLIEFESPTEAKLYQRAKFQWDECPDGRISSDCGKAVYTNGLKLGTNARIETAGTPECTTTIGGGFTNPNYSDIIRCHHKQFVVGVQHTGSAAEIEDARILVDATLKKLRSVSSDSSEYSSVESESVESESVDTELVVEPESQPVQKTSGGCGEGTVLVDGVCQLAETSVTEDNEELATAVIGVGVAVIVLGAFVLIGIPVIIIIVIVILIRRRKKTPKPAKQELDDYEEQYLAKQKPRRKPAKKKEMSAFCENCGNTLKPEAKFCGKCGTARS